jgi:hypothetical protein
VERLLRRRAPLPEEQACPVRNPGNADCAFNIFGHRYLLTHGDSLGTKGGDGIIGALGPIMRGTLKTHRSEAQIGRDFDTLLIGHWHQYITLPGLIVNNSLKGYDEYAHLVLRAPYSRPSQALWFTHPEHGLTAHWQVYLEKQLPRRSEAKPWVSWQDFADSRSRKRLMPAQLRCAADVRAVHEERAFGRLIAGPGRLRQDHRCVIELLRRSMEQSKAADGYRYTRFAIVRQTLKQLKDTVLKDCQNWLHGLGYWKVSENTFHVEFDDVRSEWVFIPLETPRIRPDCCRCS